jgi:KUP system potassium uptake protein
MTLRYGFMQRPDVAYDLTETSRRILPFDMMSTSFFLSRQIIVPSGGGRRVGRWSLRAFAAMVSLAGNAADYMNLPPNRVIELGTKIQL